MTQKELAYVEDAIGHEENIIKICNESLKKIEDESLKEFLQNEVNTHTNMKEKLLYLLEVKSNE